MSGFRQLMACAASALALAFVVTAVEPAFAKDPEPANAADAARKYCARAYKRYCAKVPPGGLESLNCLKQNIARLPAKCGKAVQQL
jgi:hypothetical protein